MLDTKLIELISNRLKHNVQLAYNTKLNLNQIIRHEKLLRKPKAN